MIEIPDNVSKYTNVYDVLMERGLIEQCTDPEAMRDLLGREKIRFYVGFDPTADCLHVGHLIQIIVFAYMLKYGHTPVALIGGGTVMVGDPSGRNDMRRMMDVEEIDANGRKFKDLFDRFLPFDDEWKYECSDNCLFEKGHENKTPDPGKAISINNAQWLRNLNYIQFVREIGTLFNVPEMLRAEAFKRRIAQGGLTFFEFNYMLMQGFDFYIMARDLGLKAQFGGNDQWSNIIAGVNIAKKRDNIDVYGMTFSLLTKSDGEKMGKTSGGALWLDENRVSVYDFFQYWRNVADADVNKCLRMLTFLPMEEVNRLSSLEGAEINKAKEILAFEVTKMVHGEAKAKKALEDSRAVFTGEDAKADNMPQEEMERSLFEGEGMGLAQLLNDLGLCKSNGDAFRTIEQGGVRLNGEQIKDKKRAVTTADFKDDKLVVQKGKKKFVAVVLK
jgi:tyrosyl-tRNA synthetase